MRPTLLQSLQRRAHYLLAGVCAVLALMYVILVPPGQPYDEPAHWDNVQWYAHELSMPELGHPGVRYEAQMGPVYYATMAVIARPVEAIAGVKAAFYSVRAVGAVLVGTAVLLTYALAMLLTRRRGVALSVAAFVGFNASLLAIAGSIQNDYLAMVLALVAALLVTRSIIRGPRSIWASVEVGAVAGLATLTKVSAVSIIPALLVPVLMASSADRWLRFRDWLRTVAVFILVTGWWFLRNKMLYGDMSGRGGVDRIGLEFPRRSFTGTSSVASWIKALIADVWVPTEYYRNAFSAPVGIRVVAVIFTVGFTFAVGKAFALFGTRRTVQHESRLLIARSTMACWVALTCVGVAVVVWVWTHFATRITFVALPAAAALIGLASSRQVPKPAMAHAAIGMLCVFLVATDAFVLFQIVQVPEQPFWIGI